MIIQPIDIFVYAWLAIALTCGAYVSWDQFTGNPEPAVMKWGTVHCVAGDATGIVLAAAITASIGFPM